MAEDNSIHLHLSFASPKEAVPIANALVAAGFPDVRMHVVLDAYATGTDEQLQQLHDRVKEIGPLIDAATADEGGKWPPRDDK
jgi:hypothetical protein